MSQILHYNAIFQVYEESLMVSEPFLGGKTVLRRLSNTRFHLKKKQQIFANCLYVARCNSYKTWMSEEEAMLSVFEKCMS